MPSFSATSAQTVLTEFVSANVRSMSPKLSSPKLFSGAPEISLPFLPLTLESGWYLPESMAAEAVRIEAALPRGARRVVLDERGERLATRDVAARLVGWMREGGDVAFLIGGADGLDPALRASADETWRLSDLTLPHALARVLFVEAIYRAWTVTTGHPYHRE